MTNGTTYIVRPLHAPVEQAAELCVYAALGSIQLLVGPAMSWLGVQMNVHCSVRATSLGLLRCR